MANDPNGKDVGTDETPQMAADTTPAAAVPDAAQHDEPQTADSTASAGDAAPAADTASVDDTTAVAAHDETAAAELPASEVAAAETPSSQVDAPPAVQAQQPTAVPQPRKAREMTGVVLSCKAEKTITVRVDRRVKHPVYGKFIRRSTKLAAHDPGNRCQEGDTVAIVESRPISRTKSWRLARIVERANG